MPQVKEAKRQRMSWVSPRRRIAQQVEEHGVMIRVQIIEHHSFAFAEFLFGDSAKAETRAFQRFAHEGSNNLFSNRSSIGEKTVKLRGDISGQSIGRRIA